VYILSQKIIYIVLYISGVVEWAVFGAGARDWQGQWKGQGKRQGQKQVQCLVQEQG
jgi:hypothetical protein